MAVRARRAALGAIWLVVMPALIGGAQNVESRARQVYTRAVELEGQGNYSAALTLLWEAAGLAPRDADVQNRLGEALERHGALDAAVEAYRRALAERPDFRKASNNLILVLVKAGKGTEAVERAEALVRASPSDSDRHFTLGLAQAEQNIDAAIASFRRTLELAPRHTLARYNLALVLRRADRLPEALDELARALAIEPRPEVHYTLGVIYWHQGDMDRAVEALRACVALDPRNRDGFYTLGSVLKSRRDWAGAERALEKAIALDPNLTAAHYSLGQVRQLAGNAAGARKAFDEAERLRQRHQLELEALVWTSVGIQRVESGDLSGALDHFRRATKVYEPYAPAHYQMGLALDRLGLRDESRAAFARAQQLNPSLVPPR
jgi:tetratricopeptide (TPR) repeat protein